MHAQTAAEVTGALLLCSTAAMLVAGRKRWAAPVSVSMIVGLVLRVGTAAVTSRHFTPRDVTTYFYATGKLVLQGKDPLRHLPSRHWNFLQLMPYVHALEIKSGLPWVYAVKIAPIAADVVVIWLVSFIAPERRATRALQYALNPVSIMVAAVHGQVEPVALALALGGVALVERARYGWAGLLLGAAVAAKTWPVLVAVAVLPFGSWRSCVRVVAGAIVVPAALLASGVVFLDTQLGRGLAHLASYTGYVQSWTWSGTLIEAGFYHAGYASGLGRIGSVLVVVAGALVVWSLRRRPAPVRGAAVLSAAVLVTAGFGVQYLMWPLPLLFAVSRRAHLGYTLAAGGWAAFDYFLYRGVPNLTGRAWLTGLSWVVAATLAITLWELFRQGREARVPAGAHFVRVAPGV